MCKPVILISRMELELNRAYVFKGGIGSKLNRGVFDHAIAWGGGGPSHNSVSETGLKQFKDKTNNLNK